MNRENRVRGEKFHRMLRIINMGEFTISELATMFEVDKRTIQRDIVMIEGAGFVFEKTGREAYKLGEGELIWKKI